MHLHGMRILTALAVAWAGASARLESAEPATASAAKPAEPAAGGAQLIPAATPEPAPTQRVADPVEVAADALVVRPVGLAATAVGAAIYVVALPFAAIAGDVHGPARSLVGAPARFTFKRKLGDFESRPL
ncbi:MAG: hypothetical protein JNL97_16755 [Verrucomicrobiales bacterium]|nr:hypothetical protein [Verrucomicrobiales bacterium]